MDSNLNNARGTTNKTSRRTRIKMGQEVTASPNNKGNKITLQFLTHLIKIYLDRSVVRWVRKCRNMRITARDTLFTPVFTDDQVVIAEAYSDALNYMVGKLQEEYELAGVNMNMAETKTTFSGVWSKGSHLTIQQYGTSPI